MADSKMMGGSRKRKKNWGDGAVGAGVQKPVDAPQPIRAIL